LRPEERDEEREDDDGKTEVVLRAENDHRESPRGEDWHEHLRGYEVESAQALGGYREQISVRREVGGEEEDQQDLRELDGLE